MEEKEIVELFWNRAENAIQTATNRYGSYCRQLAFRILQSKEDTDECVNDAMLHLWNSIPPARPDNLMGFLGKITRQLSLERIRRQNAKKRGAGQIPLVLEELQPYISGSVNPEQIHDRLVTRETINGFLRDLQPEARQMFVQRYWYLCSISQIAAEHHCGESKVKMSLQRSREKLKKLLEKEGIEV